MLVGREAELTAIDEVVARAGAGRSGALVIRGEAGIGKSTLLEYAAVAAPGMRLIRSVGIESEAELGFGALHQMLYPYVDRLDALPGPQGAALRAAFGLADTGVPHRFMVGAATLSLLAVLATETPLLCLVDDAQWLDQSSSDALLFAARRLQADPVAILFAVRETAVPFRTPGVETLWLTGLPQASAEALLQERAPGLASPVRERVLREAAGNPLAIIELGEARYVAQQAGRSDPVEQVSPLPVARRVQERFVRQIADFPAGTRLILLVVAADGTAGLDSVLRVGSSLGLSAVDLAPAEQARLVSVAGGEVAFRHPLIRAAAYQEAPHHQRIAVHKAFAEALAEGAAADRRAWHLAAAATGPDESVAAELERTAQRAQHRGGAMAVAAAYERAGRLSISPEQRARRITLAAQAAWDAGKLDRAARLAAEAAAMTDDPVLGAEATFVRAQVEYDRTSPAADAALALQAAELVLKRRPERAAHMLTEVMHVGRHACAYDLIRTAAGHLRSLALLSGSSLDASIAAQIAWSELFDGRPERAVAPMRVLLRAGQHGPIDYYSWIGAGICGLLLADDEGVVAAMESMLADARASGALGWLPYILEFLALGRLMRGEFLAAQTCVAEGMALAEEAGLDTEILALRSVSVWLAAVHGDESSARSLAGRLLPDAATRELANAAALAGWGLGLLELAAGRSGAALELLDEVCAGPARRDVAIRAVPDQVEAAVRSGQPDKARDHLPEFAHWAEQVGGPVATGLLLRCQALLAADDAEPLYLRALDLPAGAYDTARTRLLYAEWLRRRRRRTDAHAQLLTALQAFECLGAHRWAERAGTELAALGERPVARPHDADPMQRLTPQELQVVRLAANGLSNKEIGAQLYLSPRTVGHHLYKAYPKLGVTRRTELAQLNLR